MNFPVLISSHKIVLVDFYATWCEPCVEEVPNVVVNYGKYHDKGLEIIGISLDKAGAAEKLASFTKEHKMPWPQVYDGKYWKSDLVQKYGIDSIPRMILIDGDTGKIIKKKPANFTDAKLMSEETDGSLFWKMGEGRGPRLG